MAPANLQKHLVHTFGNYRFYPASQLLECVTRPASGSLTGESELLKELILHLNVLLDRKEVLLRLWGDDNFFNARNMDVYIAKLRKYLVHDHSLSIINVRGYGYKLVEDRHVR